MTARIRSAFVTGGSGFVGRHLIAHLAERGVTVRALARSDAAEAAVRAAGAQPVRGGLHSPAAMAAGMAGVDAVFHGAAVMSFWGRDAEMHETNVGGTRHVVAAAREAGVPVLVQVGAAAVVSDGRPVNGADERTPRADPPFGTYARTKAEAERIVLAADGPGLRTVVVRPPGIWGVGAEMVDGVTEAVRDGSLVWIGGGSYPYSICHVRNVCEGALLAAERGQGGQAYFLTDGAPRSFREVISAIVRTQGVAPPTRSVPRAVVWALAAAAETAWRLLRRPGSPPLTRTQLALVGGAFVVSDARARRELGYTAHVGWQDGLAELRGAKELTPEHAVV